MLSLSSSSYHEFFGYGIDLTVLEVIVFAALYASVGMLLWERFTRFSSDHECPLAASERFGSYTAAEAWAFMLVKIFFVVLWLPCLIFYGVAQPIARIRHYRSSQTKIAG